MEGHTPTPASQARRARRQVVRRSYDPRRSSDAKSRGMRRGGQIGARGLHWAVSGGSN